MPSTNGHGSSGATERVALYLRVSSEEQRDRETIELQREFLEQYRSLYEFELEVADVYEDDGVSGTIPLHERPEGRRLLEDARVGKFQTVLVYKLDRLGRTLLVIVDAHDRLMAEAGVALRSGTEPIDTSSPSGRLIFQMLASFAEYERGTMRERTQAGLHRAFRGGKHTGCIPYGYDIDDSGAFVVVEDEARVVREIIANVAAGSTLYSEAKRLNDEDERAPGHRYRGKPRKHGACWYHTSVEGIVPQGTYSGIHVVNTQNGPAERQVPAIVEPELQNKALSQLQDNKRYAGGRPGRRYLLTGLVRCEHCGVGYVGDPSRSSSSSCRYNYYYGCRKRRKTVYDKRIKDYSCPRVGAEWLENLVWRDVKGFLENPGEVLERVRKQLAETEESDDLLDRHTSLTKRLAAKQEEKSRYVKLYAQGHMDEEELDVYLTDLKNQVENLKLLISSVESDLAAKHENKVVAANTEAWLMSLKKNLAQVEQDAEEAFSARRTLVKLLVERITVSRDDEGRARVDITYRFGPPTARDASTDSVQNSQELWKALGKL
jgi:site-specific DNA recombinase